MGTSTPSEGLPNIAAFPDIGPFPVIDSIAEGALTLRPIYPGLYDREDGPKPMFLGAFTADGNEAWRIHVYDAPQLIAELEGDVQEVYFRSMIRTPAGTILIENSEWERFEVDPRSRTVIPLGPIPGDTRSDPHVTPSPTNRPS